MVLHELNVLLPFFIMQHCAWVTNTLEHHLKQLIYIIKGCNIWVGLLKNTSRSNLKKQKQSKNLKLIFLLPCLSFFLSVAVKSPVKEEDLKVTMPGTRSLYVMGRSVNDSFCSLPSNQKRVSAEGKVSSLKGQDSEKKYSG